MSAYEIVATIFAAISLVITAGMFMLALLAYLDKHSK